MKHYNYEWIGIDGEIDVNSVSKTQGYKALGNSFTVPVIEHILKAILYETK